MNYDIAIIGAGPNGNAFACSLADSNLKIALIDKFPRFLSMVLKTLYLPSVFKRSNIFSNLSIYFTVHTPLKHINYK